MRDAAASLEVVEVGFPAWKASFAKEHTSLDGGMAVIVAMLTGFGIDFLVPRLRRRRAAAKDKPLPEEAYPGEQMAEAHDGATEPAKWSRGLKPAA